MLRIIILIIFFICVLGPIVFITGSAIGWFIHYLLEIE